LLYRTYVSESSERGGVGTLPASPAGRGGEPRGDVRTFALAVLVCACGARVDGDFGAPDGRMTASGVDAPTGSDPADAPPTTGPVDASPDNACGVPANQGDVGTLAATGELRSQGSGDLYVTSLLAPTPASASDAQRDAIYVELWDDYGAFLGGHAAPGTFPITGDELSYATCGVCVFTLANVDANGAPQKFLLATSGTVTIEQVSDDAGDPLAFTTTNILFTEVDPDQFEPVGSDCPSPLAHARLTGTVEPL
jgi:hypothetical protein